MRTFILSLLLVFTASISSAFAQEAEIPTGKHRVYCELLGRASNLAGTKLKVNVDFGQKKFLWKDNRTLVDKTGKSIKFNSMVDAMNYMGQFGWKFVQAYVVTLGNANVYHWLLYKDIEKDEELTEGFQTKDMVETDE